LRDDFELLEICMDVLCAEKENRKGDLFGGAHSIDVASWSRTLQRRNITTNVVSRYAQLPTGQNLEKTLNRIFALLHRIVVQPKIEMGLLAPSKILLIGKDELVEAAAKVWKARCVVEHIVETSRSPCHLRQLTKSSSNRSSGGKRATPLSPGLLKQATAAALSHRYKAAFLDLQALHTLVDFEPWDAVRHFLQEQPPAAQMLGLLIRQAAR